MRRTALVCACLLVTGMSAQAAEPFHFEVRPEAAPSVQLRIDRHASGHRQSDWSQTVRMEDLPGLDRAILDGGGPVAFRLTRPAGTLDCIGSAHDRRADGGCVLVADPRFAEQLAVQGIGRPTEDETFQLAMSGVSLDVLDALRKEGWPRPTVSQLVQLGIFHVTAPSIHGLAKAGYRSGRIDSLVQFAIFKVTPEFIDQMRAAGLDALSEQTLVQLRIFNVTPDDVRAFTRQGTASLTPSQLIKLKMAGITPRDAQARD